MRGSTTSSKRKGGKISSEVSADAEDNATAGTPYRTAMSKLSSHANRHSKSMSPEQRVKLAVAKDEIRATFDMPQNSKGDGGPGKRYQKPRAKSRRDTTGTKRTAKPRK